jgi:hypothetical protein
MSSTRSQLTHLLCIRCVHCQTETGRLVEKTEVCVFGEVRLPPFDFFELFQPLPTKQTESATRL